MWWSAEEWEALTAPGSCGMCADAHLGENEHSILVLSTATSHVRLARNQAHPGYTLVILRDHVTDLADLAPDELGAFWHDVQRVGRAIGMVFEPRKIDYLVMGHRMPHLHCHVFPQHGGDDPKRNVDISDGPEYPPDGKLVRDAERLRSAWSAR